MSSSVGGFERRQAIRLAVLRYMYDIAVERYGNPEVIAFDEQTIARGLRCPEQEVRSAFFFLRGKGLIQQESLYDNGSSSYTIAYPGVKEVEDSLSHPERGTKEFSPHVINLVFNGNVGVVQTGPDATANVDKRGEEKA